jgi:hypothetical protein
MNEKTKKRQFLPNVQIGSGGIDAAALRQLAQNEPAEFMRKAEALIEKGEFSWENVRSLPRLFNALCDVEVPAQIMLAGQQRAVMASAFPLLAGGLTVAGINAAYMAVPTIGEELVTDREDNKAVSIYASLLSEDTQVDTVKEGEDFPEIGAGEEKYEIRHKRNGRRISITMETIEENDVANITSRINALGEIAGEFVEEQTLRRVCDIDGSGTSPAEPYVLRINGAGAALYQTDADPLSRLPSTGNRVTNNALEETPNLDTARARLAGMKNSRGKRISIPMASCTLLVPDALVGTASWIQGSLLEPGIENQQNNWGPRGKWRPRLLSSPKLDDLSTTAWYLGWFQKQFIRKWKLRYETVTLGTNTESYLKSRLGFQARIAWDCEIGATDYVYVVQNLSATTAP